MAVALDATDVAKLGPSARAQIRALPSSGAGGGTSEQRRRAAAEPKAVPIKPQYGPSNRVRAAAGATRAGWRFAGSGKPNTGGNPTIRGVLWLFVWIGVLFYLVANPSTLPRMIHIVFAPVNGVLAVAKGPHVAAPKTA